MYMDVRFEPANAATPKFSIVDGMTISVIASLLIASFWILFRSSGRNMFSNELHDRNELSLISRTFDGMVMVLISVL